MTKKIECFLPAVPVAKLRSGRAAERAFFPCYLFAHFDLEQVGESNISFLPGLRHLVKTGGQPTVVSAALVEHISRRLAASVLDAAGEVLERGDRVQILRENFEEIDVVFDARLSPDGRVRVFLRYLEERYPPRNSVEHLTPVEVNIKEIRKRD